MKKTKPENKKNTPIILWRNKLYEIIFEADTKAGFVFDVFLIIIIIFSVINSMLDSVSSLNKNFGKFFDIAEYVFTALFTIEYVLRIISSKRPLKYMFSFYGIIDIIAIIPTYVSLFVVSAPGFLFIRVLRLLRVLRVLKLYKYNKQAKTLTTALKMSLPKISVFLFVVGLLVIFIGSLIYFVEGPENGFKNIPQSIYWAIVTITTVGYGDISPKTPLGQAIASLVMIIGYSIIAVPTGIVSAEMSKSKNSVNLTTQICTNCHREGHDADAKHCKYCGASLD